MLSFKDLIRFTQQDHEHKDIRNMDHRNYHPPKTTTLEQHQYHQPNHVIDTRFKIDNIAKHQSPPPPFETSSRDFNLPSIDSLLSTKPPSPPKLYNINNNTNINGKSSFQQYSTIHQPQFSKPNNHSNTSHHHHHHHYPPTQEQYHNNQMQRSFAIASPHSTQQQHSSNSYSEGQQRPFHNKQSYESGFHHNYTLQSSKGIPDTTRNDCPSNSENGQGAWTPHNNSSRNHEYTAAGSSQWRTSSVAPQDISPPPILVTNRPLSSPIQPNHQNYSNHYRDKTGLASQQTIYDHHRREHNYSTNPLTRDSIPPTPSPNIEKPRPSMSLSLPHQQHNHHFQSVPPPPNNQHSNRGNTAATPQSSILNKLNYNTTLPNSNTSATTATTTATPNFSSNTRSIRHIDDEELYDELGGCTSYRFRKGWTKDEHIRFLIGVYIFGRGNWKNISKVIAGKSPKQVQSHAQKYFLRQEQTSKTKRSIHDFNLEDLIELLKDETYRNSVREDSTQKGRDLEELINLFESSHNNTTTTTTSNKNNNNRNKKDKVKSSYSQQSSSSSSSSISCSSSPNPSSPPIPSTTLNHQTTQPNTSINPMPSNNSNGGGTSSSGGSSGKFILPPRNKPKNKPY